MDKSQGRMWLSGWNPYITSEQILRFFFSYTDLLFFSYGDGHKPDLANKSNKIQYFEQPIV